MYEASVLNEWRQAVDVLSNKDLINIVLEYVRDDIDETAWIELFRTHLHVSASVISSWLVPYMRPSKQVMWLEKLFRDLYNDLLTELHSTKPKCGQTVSLQTLINAWVFEPVLLPCPDILNDSATRGFYHRYAQKHLDAHPERPLTYRASFLMHMFQLFVTVVRDDQTAVFWIDGWVRMAFRFFFYPSITTYEQYVTQLRNLTWTPSPILELRLYESLRLVIPLPPLNDARLAHLVNEGFWDFIPIGLVHLHNMKTLL